jgi:hypothetical protein
MGSLLSRTMCLTLCGRFAGSTFTVDPTGTVVQDKITFAISSAYVLRWLFNVIRRDSGLGEEAVEQALFGSPARVEPAGEGPPGPSNSADAPWTRATSGSDTRTGLVALMIEIEGVFAARVVELASEDTFTIVPL